jgi:hypothetical protein
MKRLIFSLVFALAIVMIQGNPKAEAGRIGGPASQIVAIPASQSLYYDVSFTADSPAIVSVIGGGLTNVDLYVYDGDGNVTRGAGIADRKTAVIAVYRAGSFRIELRNMSLVPSTVVVSTN